jgi:PAS domain-containing protein
MKATDGFAHAFEPTAASSWCLFDFVGSGVAVTTADGTVEFCNTALLQLMAQRSKTLLGSSIFELLNGGVNGELQRSHRDALATNTEVRTSVRNYGGGFVANAVLRRVDRPAYRKALTRHLDGHAPPYEVEYRVRARSGNWRWIMSGGRAALHPLPAAHRRIRSRSSLLDRTRGNQQRRQARPSSIDHRDAAYQPNPGIPVHYRRWRRHCRDPGARRRNGTEAHGVSFRRDWRSHADQAAAGWRHAGAQCMPSGFRRRQSRARTLGTVLGHWAPRLDITRHHEKSAPECGAVRGAPSRRRDGLGHARSRELPERAVP